MTRSPQIRWPLIAVLAVAALLAGATARAIGSKAQERRKQILEEAETQRKKLGLDDRAKLFASYPTPELQIGSAWKPIVLAPGQSGAVRVPGRFVKDTQVVLNSDAVALASSTFAPDEWRGQLTASKDALPAGISVSFFTPVSGAEVDTEVAMVLGKLELQIKFDDGTRALLRPQSWDGLKNSATVDWYDRGAKEVTRSSNAEVRFEPGGVSISIAPSQQDLDAQAQYAGEAQKIYLDPDMQKRMGAISKKMMACTKLPQDQMTPCMLDINKESDALQKEMKTRADASKAAYDKARPRGPKACLEWQLHGTASGLTGQANCGGDSPMKLSGTARYTGAAE